MITPIENKYDYIIVGAGCSGLSLLMRMLRSPLLSAKKILLVDKAPKAANDKTWCFWDKGNIESFWQHAGIIHHEWSNLYVKHAEGSLLLDIAPYKYKMVRSADFYRHCFSVIKSSPNVKVAYGNVSHIDAQNGIVFCNDESFEASYIFSSVLLDEPHLRNKDFYLLQHFKGWWVETKNDCFNPGEADLMNFRTSQKYGCTFLYVLPVTKTRALVEYTLFTEDLLEDEQYDEGLRDFVGKELQLSDYTVSEVEKGVIPMTDMHFPPQQQRVFFIGTAGGQTKASTGYTFAFIQKQSDALVKSMEINHAPVVQPQPARFNFYDSVLLRILQEKKLPGADVFYKMFSKNKASTVLRFLDNETGLLEELQIMNSTNKSVFVPAAVKTIF